jgi:hypothetical protein
MKYWGYSRFAVGEKLDEYFILGFEPAFGNKNLRPDHYTN